MTKKLYLYKQVERCNPESGAYHEGGGLVVITSGYPNDTVPLGTGNAYNRNGVKKHALPEADLVITVPDDTPTQVIVFENAGCC